MADSVNGIKSASSVAPNSTIGDVLDRQAERFAERDALVNVETGERYTYAEFRDEVERVARGLMALGIQRGHHVGIWATNYSEWVLTQFATAKIGAVMVNVNPAYRTHELAYVLGQSEANALILIGRFRNSDYAAMLNEVVPELKDSNPGELRSSQFPYLRNVICIPPHGDGADAETPAGMWAWDEMVAKHSEVSPEQLAARQSECHPDDPINIQYTSGTTGNPKGAMLTHHNLVSNGLYVGDAIELTENDRLCVPVPFYHCFGCVMGNLGCITHGSAIIIASEHFDPLKTLQALERERCTALYGVPTMFIAQLGHEDFDSFDVSSLRTGIMAGSPCPIEVMRQVIDRMGAHQMTIAYGQTEHSPVITQTLVSDSIERRVSTVGAVLPGVEARIVDPESGEILGPGVQGELQARSSMVMRGYYNMPEATAAAIDEEGWLHTGDLAEVDGGRLLQDYGPPQGHDYPRRRERLPARNRGIPLHPPQDFRCSGHRRSRRAFRRGSDGLGDAEAGGIGRRRRNPRVLPGQNRPLQSSPLREGDHRVSNDCHWQNPEVPYAGDGSGGVGIADGQPDRNGIGVMD